MIAIIGGTSLMDSSLFAGWGEEPVRTPYGDVKIKTDGVHVFVQRHGNPPLPPHRINHRANIRALKDMDVDKVVAINSTGSLKLEIEPGTFIIPHDFISFWDVPTFFDNEMRFMIPAMDAALRGHFHNQCRELKMEVLSEGVYVQTRGPRLETRAEIEFLSGCGDVVGMTMASEATLCMEMEIPYVSLCSIDNYCNGIVKIPLTMEEIRENGLNSLKTIEALLQKILSEEHA
jgi:5'-methylthioadenosine phosphorylase